MMLVDASFEELIRGNRLFQCRCHVGEPGSRDRVVERICWNFHLQLNTELSVTRKILINGRREEEVRVAIVENQTLEDFEIETKNSGLLRNNIYRGIVSNIAPSLNAAFIDFGDVKNGFLAFNDVVESAYHKPVKDAQRISDVLVVGQPLIVQVIKDATGLKGAQVTTNISLAGRYLVLRPKDAKSGVSRKVDEDARADLTQKARSLDLPDGYGCIVRTNAMDQSRAILLRDAKVLIQLWHKIEAEYEKSNGPTLLYNDQDIVVQAMRDYFDSTINEVLIDNRSCYERALAYIHATVDGGSDRIKYYDDRTPLFTRYNIERQINQIYARTVTLPSGGFIVIDPTEALTAIDVNSARATKRDSQDLTAYHTNLEAAAEIGRQLRMRDIGGLIVIDFIDMKSSKYQRDVERAMRTAMARDKARNKCERISANGLLEINRQRLSQALSMRTHLECPTCGGRGFIPTIEALGLNLIREIEARAVQGSIAGAIISLSPENAQTVQNARRHDIAQLEEDYHLHIEICAVREMSRGDESIEWLTKEAVEALHPGSTPHTNTCAIDVSSVVEVTEAYNAQSPIVDDSYRPNDFEEFSSEEARKRRASRRAKRGQGIVDAAPAVEPAVTPAQALDATPDTSMTQKRVGLAVLTSLIRSAAPHLDERGNEPRRRMNIRGHRRPHREDGGIKMDTCLFALDMIRAICTIDGVEGEVSRKQLIENADRVVNWLSRALTSPEEIMSSRCAALIAQTTSRHARARLEVLFSGTEPASSDALGIALCTERDIVLHKFDGNSSRKALHAIDAAIAKRIAEVFGEKKEAPVAPVAVKDTTKEKATDKTASNAPAIQAPSTFDTSALEAQDDDPLAKSRRSRHTRRNRIADADVDLAHEQTPENMAQAVATPPKAADAIVAAAAEMCAVADTVEAEDASNGSRRRRRHSRKAIGELPQFRDNNEVVCADVEVAPMTVIKDAEEDENDIAQAITQELPAIEAPEGSFSQRDRRERSRRRVARSVATSVDAVEVSPIAEAVADVETATDDVVMPARRERRERRRERVATAATQKSSQKEVLQIASRLDNDAISKEIDDLFSDLMYRPMQEIEVMAPNNRSDEQRDDASANASRVRRARRGHIGDDVVTPEKRDEVRQNDADTDAASEQTTLVAAKENDVVNKTNERRPRRTRSRATREQSDAIDTEQQAQLESVAKQTITSETDVASEPAVATDKETKPETMQRRETRRVRKTTARRVVSSVENVTEETPVTTELDQTTLQKTVEENIENVDATTTRPSEKRVRRSGARRAIAQASADTERVDENKGDTNHFDGESTEALPNDSENEGAKRVRKTRRSRMDEH